VTIELGEGSFRESGSNTVKLSHSLEAQMPNGDWFADIVGDLFFRMAAA
jgi:hypothetical protein